MAKILLSHVLNRRALSVISACVLLMTAGCAQHTHYSSDVNHSDVDKSQVFYGQSLMVDEKAAVIAQAFRADRNDPYCLSSETYGYAAEYYTDQPLLTASLSHLPPKHAGNRLSSLLPLSPGDLISVEIENGEGFTGNYVLDNAGLLSLPIVAPIEALGKSPQTLAKDIERVLVRGGIFLPATALVSVRVLQLAAIDVPVRGAVFQPGRVQINAVNPYSKNDIRTVSEGDFSTKRLVSEALRAAHGVRPDAKLDHIIVVRDGWQIQVDLSGILTGQPVEDFALISGDQVIVPSAGCFQPHLVKPSQITPKGFRVFMSNLIDSAHSNASAAVGRYSTNLPYGTKLLQAAVSANCIGGKAWTNAPRKVVLASVHPVTQKTQVIERSVEELLRGANRESINPFLMPNDSLACYDSTVTNFRDVASTLKELVSPVALFF